jgi:hypothetical protein
MLRKITLASLATLGLLMIGAAPAQAAPPVYPDHVHHYHVQYRSPFWKERSFDCHEYAHEFEHRMRRQGFQAHVVHHGDHFHVRYRMLNWHTYRTVPSHRLAHELEHLLEARGYQARVVHH